MATKLSCATTSVAAAPTTTPLADVGNIPTRGARSNDESRRDLYRCVHSYFRWRAETLESSSLSSPSDHHCDFPGPGEAVPSPKEGSASGGAETAVASDPAGGGEASEADVEVGMCRRIVSALEEALPQLIGGANITGRPPSPDGAAARDDVSGGRTAPLGGTNKENDGFGTQRRHSAGQLEAAVNASDKTWGDGGGRGAGGESGKAAEAAAPATIEGNKLPDVSLKEGESSPGTTDNSGQSSDKEAGDHASAPTPAPEATTMATRPASSAPSRPCAGSRPDDHLNPSWSDGPNPPSPELETRYDSYPNHLRQIYSLQAQVLQLRRELQNKSHCQPQRQHKPPQPPQQHQPQPQPQPQPQHPRQPPFWWPATTTPWQQQQPQHHPNAQFSYYYPNHQHAAACFAAGGGQINMFPQAAAWGAVPMMMMGPGGGSGSTLGPAILAGPGPCCGPSGNIGTDGRGSRRTGGDGEKAPPAAVVIARASLRKKGAATKEDDGGGSYDEDSDDDDGVLTKMGDSDGEIEDSSVEESADDDTSYGDSSENENEDDHGDDLEEASVEEETRTAAALSEDREATVRRKAPTLPAHTKKPTSRRGKKKRKLGQGLEPHVAVASRVNATMVSAEETEEGCEASTGHAITAAVAAAAGVETDSNEATSGASSARKRTKRSAAVAATWEARFQELVEYQRGHGHCRVNVNCKANPALAKWVSRLRHLYARHWEKEEEPAESNMLSREKVDRLNALGFAWRIRPEGYIKPWQYRFDELVTFKERMGHTRVPRHHKVLGEWVHVQRASYRKGNLSDKKIEMLNEIGFEWNIVRHPIFKWERRFEQLVRYRRKYGHCNVTLEAAIKMAAEDSRVCAGEDQGTSENQNAEEVDCAVVNKSFFSWAERQKKEYYNFRYGRKSTLDGRKVRKLEQIGFDFMLNHTESTRRAYNGKNRTKNPRVPWERRLQALCTYQLTHGHVNVPFSYEEDDNLGAWARQMRQRYQKHMRGDVASEETARHFEEMTKIGFSWNRGPAVKKNKAAPKPWNERYEELLGFIAEKGHTRVPPSYVNSTLAVWVGEQRKAFKKRQDGKKSHLKDDQVRMLNEIGFEWRLGSSSKEKST